MKKSWKPFAEWATAFKNSLTKSFRADIFTTARVKIMSLYLLMGVIILTVAGYLVYTHVISVVQNIIIIIRQLLTTKATIDQGITSNLILQSINQEVQNMNVSIGIWVTVALIGSAYILAGITLRPIRRAMERQKRFIANVSHELRTPLAIMKTGTEVTLAEAEELSNVELTTAIQSNLEEVNRMVQITQFLLDFSHVENRLSRLSFSRVDLSAVAHATIAFAEKTAHEKNIKVIFVPAESAFVQGNAVALEEMILNLLKNAVTYTPVGGLVRVTITQRKLGRYGRVILTVQDTGIGILENDIPRLFEPFYRGKNATGQRSHTSTGLGLAIVKEIVDLHRATIVVKSAPGKGTIVSVRFASAA